MNGSHGNGGWLGHAASFKVDILWKLMQAFFSLTDILCEGTIDVHTHAGSMNAESDQPCLTKAAFTAGIFKAFGGHPVALFEACDTIPYLDNDA